jgi:hypothetical protein
MCAYGAGIKKDTRKVYSVKGLNDFNDLNGFSGSHRRARDS